MDIAQIVERAREHLVKEENAERSYAVISDFSGTYIGKQMEKEERMVYPIFRVFEAAKPERSRKVNVDPRHHFDPFSDSLLDYGSIIGAKLKKDWGHFNRLISVHVPSCPNHCWHCYLPKELLTSSDEAKHRWQHLTGKELVSRFLNQREADLRNKKQSNVLRITGGEPFLLPDLLLNCLENITDKGLENEVFLWTETNLLPFIGKDGKAFMDRPAQREVLDKLGSFNNFAVHPCFHGLDPAEFNDITGTRHSVTLDQQLEGIRRLLNAKIQVYPTFGSNVCNPTNVPQLFERLIAVAPDLPLKLALVKYDTDYEPIRKRLKLRQPSPRLYSHYATLRIWNRLLLERYGVGYGILPRHIASTNEPPLPENQPAEDAGSAISASREIVWLLKSSFRDLYHREILDYLAYPYDHIIEITYEKRHVQDDLFFHMGQCPSAYAGRSAIWCYADDPHKTRFPFRLAQICDVSRAGDVLTLKLRLKDFVSFSGLDNGNLPLSLTRILKEYFGEKAMEPEGRYMLLGEYPLEDDPSANGITETRLSQAFRPSDGQVTLDNDASRFSKIIPHFVAADKMKTSVFYRIETEKLKQTEEDNCTFYHVKGGKSFTIHLHSFLPNYDNFDEKTPEKRTIAVELSSSVIAPSGPTQAVCSKYGRESFSFRTEKVAEKKEVRLTFRCPTDQFRAAKVELRIIVVIVHHEA